MESNDRNSDRAFAAWTYKSQSSWAIFRSHALTTLPGAARRMAIAKSLLVGITVSAIGLTPGSFAAYGLDSQLAGDGKGSNSSSKTDHSDREVGVATAFELYKVAKQLEKTDRRKSTEEAYKKALALVRQPGQEQLLLKLVEADYEYFKKSKEPLVIYGLVLDHPKLEVAEPVAQTKADHLDSAKGSSNKHTNSATVAVSNSSGTEKTSNQSASSPPVDSMNHLRPLKFELDEVSRKHVTAMMKYFSARKYPEAIKEIDAAIEHAPKSSPLYLNRATMKSSYAHSGGTNISEGKRLGLLEEAVKDLDKSLHLGFPAEMAGGQLAALHIAIGAMKKNIGESKDEVNAHYNQAYLVLKRLVELSPRNSSLDSRFKISMARALNLQGKYVEALALVDKSLESDVGNYRLPFLLMKADSLNGLGKADQAKLVMDEVDNLGGKPKPIKAPPQDQPFSVSINNVKEYEKLFAPLTKKARATLPSVKERFLLGLKPGERLSMTIKLSDSHGRFEQVFASVDTWKGDKISGRIASNIMLVKGYRIGDRITFDTSDVMDWTIVRRDGTEEGNLIGKYIDSMRAGKPGGTGGDSSGAALSPSHSATKVSEGLSVAAGATGTKNGAGVKSEARHRTESDKEFSAKLSPSMDSAPDAKEKAKKIKIPSTKRDFLNIIDKANKRLKKDPKDAGAYIDLGYAYGNLMEPWKDIECCNKAIAIDPNIAVAYSERASAFMMVKKFDKALFDLDKAIKIDPNNSAFYCTKGWVYGYLGKYNKAIDECTRSIRIHDGYSPAFYCRARAYLSTDQYEKAIKDYSQAIKLFPNEVSDYYSERGLAYNNIEDYQKAIADFNQALKIEPHSVGALVYRGCALSSTGEYRAAISNFNEAIRLEPELAQAYTNRGLTYLKLEKNDKGLEDLNKAIELDPDSFYVYKDRGVAYMALGKISEAIEDFRKAISINSSNVICLDKLASAYMKQRAYQKAIDTWTKAIAIDPLLPEAFSKRGQAYGELGRLDKEKEDCYSAIAVDPTHKKLYLDRHKRALENLN